MGMLGACCGTPGLGRLGAGVRQRLSRAGVRPDVLRLNAFGRGGTGVACYRGEGVGGPHQFGDVGDADQQYRVGGANE